MLCRFLCLCFLSLWAVSYKIWSQSITKTFHQVGSNGFCASASNEEYTARRFQQVGCAEAQAACAVDEPCIAFACTDTYNLSVLYTSTGCTQDCEQSAWLQDPNLITGSVVDSSQPYWNNATCHVMVEVTTSTTTTSTSATTTSTSTTTTSTAGVMPTYPSSDTIFHFEFNDTLADAQGQISLTSSDECDSSNFVQGVSGNGYQFTRGGGCSITTADFSSTFSAWTLTWWFKPVDDDTSSGRTDFFYTYPNSGRLFGAQHYTYNRDGGILGSYHINEQDSTLYTTTSSWTVGQWHNIAITSDGSTLTMYVNGSAQNTLDEALSDAGVPAFRFGDFTGTAGYIIDEFAAWSRVLTTAEIAGISTQAR